MQTTFTQRVLKIVQSIPCGETLSYKEVAERAGSPQASRAVGSILKKNTSKTIPCHRVIKSSGLVGEYNGLRGISKKELLILEKKKRKNPR